jgi:hypothetical protein
MKCLRYNKACRNKISQGVHPHGTTTEETWNGAMAYLLVKAVDAVNSDPETEWKVNRRIDRQKKRRSNFGMPRLGFSRRH